MRFDKIRQRKLRFSGTGTDENAKDRVSGVVLSLRSFCKSHLLKGHSENKILMSYGNEVRSAVMSAAIFFLMISMPWSQ